MSVPVPVSNKPGDGAHVRHLPNEIVTHSAFQLSSVPQSSSYLPRDSSSASSDTRAYAQFSPVPPRSPRSAITPYPMEISPISGSRSCTALGTTAASLRSKAARAEGFSIPAVRPTRVSGILKVTARTVTSMSDFSSFVPLLETMTLNGHVAGSSLKPAMASTPATSDSLRPAREWRSSLAPTKSPSSSTTPPVNRTQTSTSVSFGKI